MWLSLWSEWLHFENCFDILPRRCLRHCQLWCLKCNSSEFQEKTDHEQDSTHLDRRELYKEGKDLRHLKACESLRCGKRNLSPATGPQVVQYQGASSCKTGWCASGQVWRLLLADLRASNWRAGKQRGSLSAPYLPASDSQFLAPATRISRAALVQRCHYSRE